jgi:hypothetical protein
MATPRVYIVHLRRPRSSDPDERRDDPFYEVGSFGCTGCHGSNLLQLRHAEELAGARMAFAQGGGCGFRLVLLTPPVTVQEWARHCEVRWTPQRMPFNYQDAPVLARNDGYSDFAVLKAFVKEASRSSLEACFSSRFRSRAIPLPPDLAEELVQLYDSYPTSRGSIATTYVDSLPYPPPWIETNRVARYRSHIRRLQSELRPNTKQVATGVAHRPSASAVGRCRGVRSRRTAKPGC